MTTTAKARASAASVALELRALEARVADLEARATAAARAARLRDWAAAGLALLYVSGMLGYLVRLALGLAATVGVAVAVVVVVRPAEPPWLVPAAAAVGGVVLRAAGKMVGRPAGQH
jgi:hypothetical protein